MQGSQSQLLDSNGPMPSDECKNLMQLLGPLLPKFLLSCYNIILVSFSFLVTVTTKYTQ